jgi:hypothetical protein
MIYSGSNSYLQDIQKTSRLDNEFKFFLYRYCTERLLYLLTFLQIRRFSVWSDFLRLWIPRTPLIIEFSRKKLIIRRWAVIRRSQESLVLRTCVFSCGVLTRGQWKLKKWPTRKSEPSQSHWTRRQTQSSRMGRLRQSLIVCCCNWF